MSTIAARSRALPVLAALLALGAAPQGQKAPKGAPLRPVAIALPEGSAPQAPLFVRADRRGAVFLVGGADLKALPLRPDGKTGAALQHDPARLSGGPPLRFALSRSGDWLVLAPPEIRLLHDGKEKVLPALGWLPIDVGFLRDDPVVNANGVRLDRPPPGGATEDPPLVLRFDGRKWEPLVREPMPEGLRGPEPRAHESRSVHLLGDAKGTLWLANEYLYRLRRYSPSGRLLLELTLGPQKLEARKEAGKAQERFAKETRGRAWTVGGTATARASTSRRTILALTEGRDGRLYLLVQDSQGPDGLSLDRFDPLLLRLERAPLALEAEGYLSMAAGQDALYFAAFSAEAGPWKLDWSEIEAADWQELDGLRIDPHEG